MNAPKRILILSFYYPPDLSAGSFRAGALIDALLPMAANKDIHIDLMTTMPNRYHTFNMPSKNEECIPHLTIHRIQLPKHRSGFIDQTKAFVYYFFKTYRIANKKKYDLIYASSSRLFTAFLGALLSKRKNTPLFLDIRDIFTKTMSNILKFPLRFALPIFSMTERYTLKTATALNLVSPEFFHHFQHKIKADCRILFFSNGIDSCFRNFSHQQNNSPIKKIFYAGNVGEGQGLEKIIPYLAQHFSNRIVFQIMGDGGRLNILKQACLHLKNVEFFSPVSRNELIQKYQQADILFLHLNDYAAFHYVLPSKIFEYAMTGKPILAGVSGYAADFLKKEVPQSFIFPPCKIQEGITQLHEVLATPLKIKSTAKFYDKFNREKLMRDLANQIVATVSKANFNEKIT